MQEQSIEQFIVQEDVVVTLSQRGYIKRVPINTYRTQRRGGKGVRGTSNRDDDAVMQIAVTDTHGQLLFFTNRGRVYPLNVYETPSDAGRTARGTLLVNLIKLQPGEQVQTMLPVRRGDYNNLYIFATRKGRVNALRPGQLQNLRQSGLLAMKIQEGDELVAVRPAHENAAVMLVTEQGQALLCAVESIPERNRNATGVIGMKFRGNDRVVAMDVVNNPQDEFLLVVSDKGYGKATPLHNSKGEAIYTQRGRGGIGVKTFAVDQGDKPTGPGGGRQDRGHRRDERRGWARGVYYLRAGAGGADQPGRGQGGEYPADERGHHLAGTEQRRQRGVHLLLPGQRLQPERSHAGQRQRRRRLPLPAWIRCWSRRRRWPPRRTAGTTTAAPRPGTADDDDGG